MGNEVCPMRCPFYQYNLWYLDLCGSGFNIYCLLVKLSYVMMNNTLVTYDSSFPFHVTVMVDSMKMFIRVSLQFVLLTLCKLEYDE